MNTGARLGSRGFRSLATKYLFYGGLDLVTGTCFLSYLHALERSQWYSRQILLELQNRKLTALIHHAVEKVPYYEQLFRDLGLASDDIRAVDDLQKLPFLTKEIVRSSFDELRSGDWQRRHPVLTATSGSTGAPMKYLFDRDCVAMGWACMFRSWGWDGYRFGDRRVLIRGIDFESYTAPLWERIRRRVERNLVLSSHPMGPAQALDCARAIMAFRAEYVRGHPAALAAVAQEMLGNSLAIRGVRAVHTTGEQLIPTQRALIEQAFQCPVRDQYGLNDGGALILQCPESRTGGLYHIIPERSVVEVLKPDGAVAQPGETGEIVTTDLHNYAMPFIRYRTGDLAVVDGGQCSCGRAFPTIRRIDGRLVSAVKRADGTMVTGLVLAYAFEQLLANHGCVRQYRIVQDFDLSITVLVVADDSYDEAAEEAIRDGIRTRVGAGIGIAIKRVPEIPPGKNGKRQFVVSHAR